MGGYLSGHPRTNTSAVPPFVMRILFAARAVRARQLDAARRLRPSDECAMICSFEECLDIESVLDFTLAQGLCLGEAELGNVQLMDWKTGYLKIASQKGFGEEFLTFFKNVTTKDGSVCARALRRREPVIVEDVISDIEFASFWAIACPPVFRAVQSTPIVSSSGALIGVLSTHFPSPHKPSNATMAALKALARSAANAIIIRRSAMNDVNWVVERSRQALEDSYRVLRLT
jgi:GAF domain-containing protein